MIPFVVWLLACDDPTPASDGGAERDAGIDAALGPCVDDAECQNGDLCDGAERCERGACAPALGRLLCEDDDPCTANECDPTAGCRFPTLDADGDGDPACSDCDDSDPARYVGNVDVCDGIDNDCDRVADEGTAITYYADCDGDGRVPFAYVSIVACSEPDPSLTGCGTATEAWVMSEPSEETVDCADNDPRAFTGATSFHTTPISDFAHFPDFDFDCDLEQDYEIPATGSCAMATDGCSLVAGWANGVPDCGEGGDFVAGCGISCVPVISTRTQGCR